MSGYPIEVWLRNGHPIRFVYRDRHFDVRRILAYWEDRSAGDHDCWRVEVDRSLRAAELRYEPSTDTWVLAHWLGSV